MAHIRSEYIKNLIEDKNALNESLRETTKETLKTIVDEAVNKNLKKMITESDDDYEEEEVDKDEDTFDTDNTDTKDDDETADDTDTDATDTENGDDDGGEDEDVWASLEQYKGEDGEYDLTDLGVEDTVKVLKNMGPDDGVRIVSTGDGEFKLSDDQTGVEYVIDMDDIEGADEEDDFEDEDGMDDEVEYDVDVDVNPEDDTEEVEFEVSSDSDDVDIDVDDDEVDIDVDDDDDDYIYVGGDDDDLDECNEGEIHDYTDNYQGSSAMTTLPNEEPSSGYKNSKNDWDKGAPHGTGKRFSSLKAKQTPFTEGKVDEMTVAGGAHTERKDKRTGYDRHRGPFVEGENPNAGNPTVVDNNIKESIKRKANVVFEENRQLKKLAEKIKRRLSEACVINASLGKIIKLITENTTTRDEKINIVERFNNVRNINEGNRLYETISRELKQSHKINNIGNTINGQLSESKKHDVVETAMYQSQDLSDTLNLMERLNRIK